MQKIKNLAISTKTKIYRWTSFILCALIMFFAFLVLVSPIFTISNNISVYPFDLIKSIDISDIRFSSFDLLYLSYYISKYYFMVYAFVLAITIFLLVYYAISKNEKLTKKINTLMMVVLVLLFVAMLLGNNYINIYKTIYSEIYITTPTTTYFIIGLILIISKYLIDIIIGRDLIKDEIKESSISIATSFVLMFLTLSTLFFPLYIFPGTRYRMRGIDVLSGKEDVLSFLPMSETYKTLIVIYIIITSISFILNIFLFLKNRKVFVFYNKINNIFGLSSIILYAFMGLNYIIVYVDAQAYSTFFNTSINTYSYMPLLLLILFWLGTAITKMTTSRLNIEYKVYANPGTVPGANGVIAQPANNAVGDDIVYDPIPAFTELDRKKEQFNLEYQEKLEHRFENVTLPKLVKHIIEYARYSEDRLSYGPVEIKTFIAGLASSRLAILQGMSGTGKTSLPKIFMEAIDGICDLVAVESSWRDKSELLGFYSEFKRKYTPKSFTQFLYKATHNKDIPYFIVLDEMNLSRIEYYFSDFLSIMENRENMRHIKLFDIQLYPHNDERTEYLGLRDGHTIDIPTNVWFIGTANRDESTFEISDKVYDRAQTINFDKRASKVYVPEQVNYPKKFVSYSELRKLFDETKKIGFDAENYEIIKKVEVLLKPYNISFGNRILKQIEDFVNAYVSCSEIESNVDYNRYVQEAVDCIMFSKVVRKLELKQVMDIDILIEEFEKLGLTKCVEFLHTLVDTI